MPKHDRHPKLGKEPEPEIELPTKPRGRLFGMRKRVLGSVSALLLAVFSYASPIPAQIASKIFVELGGKYVITNWLPYLLGPAAKAPDAQAGTDPKLAPKTIETGSITQPPKKRKPKPPPKEDKTFLEKLKDLFTPAEETSAPRR